MQEAEDVLDVASQPMDFAETLFVIVRGAIENASAYREYLDELNELPRPVSCRRASED